MNHYNGDHIEMDIVGEDVISRGIKTSRGMQGGNDEQRGKFYNPNNLAFGQLADNLLKT